MPILSPIGRKHPRNRVLIALIYVILICSSATMVYPFLLMISGSLKSNVDYQQWDIVPRYLYDQAALFQKFVQSKYNENLSHLNIAHKARYFSFEKVVPPARLHPRAVADWQSFLASEPLRQDDQSLGFISGARIMPQNSRLLLKHLRSKSGGDIHLFNATYGTTYDQWDQPIASGNWVERWTDRHYHPVAAPLGPIHREVRRERPSWEFYPVSLDGDFLERQIYPKFGKFKIDPLNQAYQTNFTSFTDLCLPAQCPRNPEFARDWEQYVRTLLHPRYIRVNDSAKPLFEQYVRDKYQTIEAFNSVYGTQYQAWVEIPLPHDFQIPGVMLSDFTQFVERVAPVEALQLSSIEFRYRDFLRRRYAGNLSALTTAHEIPYANFDTVVIPALEADWSDMLANRNAVRNEFLIRNYAIVLDYIVLHGHALQNTLIFCALSIATALIINPLAAYALSRYQLPSQYKILFFLMATMAFPAEVTLIPGFLLLKQLDLLNTFWALVLPAAANGYVIFLLKGFFDSLPRELYESAMLDGASEWRMFWGLTMSLSTPILAVVALGAFASAYGAFMFALIVCQDEKMWTIMVYLYQLQQQYGPPVVFASLIVAAVPTLLVFIFCQNIIMRGIVVPVEK